MIKIALCSALFSMFLDFCMGEGMILDYYHRAISYLPQWLFKPLGGCIYCFSSWVFIVLFLYSSQKNAGLELNVLDLLSGLGINYIVIKIADKLELV